MTYCSKPTTIGFLLTLAIGARGSTCDDSCGTSNNGVCDATCALGTDCSDCTSEDDVSDTIILISIIVGSVAGGAILLMLTYEYCVLRPARSKRVPVTDTQPAVTVPPAPRGSGQVQPSQAVGVGAREPRAPTSSDQARPAVPRGTQPQTQMQWCLHRPQHRWRLGSLRHRARLGVRVLGQRCERAGLLFRRRHRHLLLLPATE